MKRKIALGIGVAVAFIGAAGWMRQIASWRPHVIARLDFNPNQMELSRDGRLLFTGIVTNPELDVKTVVVDPIRESVTSDPRQIRAFWKNPSAPRLSLNKSQTQLIFTPAPGKNVLLEGKIVPQYFDFDASGKGARAFSYFQARHEIYRYGYNELHIWDSQTGRLKSHIHPAKFGISSPDGLSSLRFTHSPQGVNALIRCNVPGGKIRAVIYRAQSGLGNPFGYGNYGWSPDGKFLYFIRQDSLGKPVDFNVLRAADSKLIWSAPCAGPSKWLPDGRIGLIQKDGFSWRDAAGREIGRASGPLPGPSGRFGARVDWQASPDGQWIYSIDGTTGLIRRWRAK